MGYAYDSRGGAGEGRGRPREVRTMAALCSRAGILLTSLLTRLAGDRVTYVRAAGFLPASNAASLAAKSGKAPSRAFLDHCTRGARIGMPRVKVDGDSPTTRNVPSLLYSDTTSTTPTFLLHSDRVIAESHVAFLFVAFHQRHNNYLM